MTSETETTVLCAYRTCWRDANPDMLLCDRHANQVRDDLSWVMGNVRDLTEYRLNRAYGHKQGGGAHGNSGSAPAPLREQLAVLLYETDDHDTPGLEPTLLGWAGSLGLNVTARDGMDYISRRIASCYRLWANTATPVYAEDLHNVVRSLIRFTRDEDDVIVYGQCPAPNCLARLSAPEGATMVKCPHCGSQWTVSLLKAERHQRIIASGWVATQKDLLTALDGLGVHVNPATMRSWVHRNQLEQAGENEYSQPVYRLHDAYKLACRELKEDQPTDVWNLITTSKETTK